MKSEWFWNSNSGEDDWVSRPGRISTGGAASSHNLVWLTDIDSGEDKPRPYGQVTFGVFTSLIHSEAVLFSSDPGPMVRIPFVGWEVQDEIALGVEEKDVARYGVLGYSTKLFIH